MENKLIERERRAAAVRRRNEERAFDALLRHAASHHDGDVAKPGTCKVCTLWANKSGLGEDYSAL